jgi:hypothetical protein
VDYEYNKRQTAAIARLEKALAACKKAGLAMRGMDADLLVLPRKEAVARGYDEELDDHAAWRDAWSIEHSGVYIDSGGF